MNSLKSFLENSGWWLLWFLIVGSFIIASKATYDRLTEKTPVGVKAKRSVIGWIVFDWFLFLVTCAATLGTQWSSEAVDKKLSIATNELSKIEDRTSERLYIDQDGSAKTLSKFSDMNVVVIADEKGTLSTAKQISWTLDAAHWNRKHPTALSRWTPFLSGVWVTVQEDPNPTNWFQQVAQNARKHDAARELIRELNKTDIGAREGPRVQGNDKFNDGWIIVQVGRKPTQNELEMFKATDILVDRNATPEERFQAHNKMWEATSNMQSEVRTILRGANSGGEKAD